MTDPVPGDDGVASGAPDLPPDPNEIGAAARACLVILALGLVLLLVACVLLVARPAIGGG